VQANEVGRGHDIYEDLRTLEGIKKVLKAEGGNIPTELDDKTKALDKESFFINEEAWTKFIN